MNQILSVENNKGKKKSKNSGPIAINSILVFFSISLIIFGVFIAGSGSYAIYKNINTEEPATKPRISLENKTETSILLKVMHDKAIDTVSYYWNEEEKTTIKGNQRKYIEQEIKIPTGTNTLNIEVKDINGEEITHNNIYTIEPTIKIEHEIIGNNVQITAESETKLSYMTYRWDDNDEEKIDINAFTIEQKIEIPKGLHKLTVIIVDQNNNTETKELEINGVTKPTLEVTVEGDDYVIKATDEEQLQKIVFTTLVDGKKYVVRTQEKEFEFRFPLVEGENQINITVYNSNDITVTKNYKCVR